MTILMLSDKSLVITVNTPIYQRDKLVDKLLFLIPSTYEDINLSDFDVILKYKDQMGNVNSELLTKQDGLYKERYIQCVLPVDTNLSSRYNGRIYMRLTLNKIDLDTMKEYSLNTSETSFYINPVSDYYEDYIPDSNYTAIEQKLNEINVKIKALDKMSTAYNEEKADGIKLDSDTSELYLTANDKPIGDKISLNDLGDTIADSTKDGLISVII